MRRLGALRGDAVACGTLLLLLSATAGWEHHCGAGELTVEKGKTIAYLIRGHSRVLEFEVVEKGNPLVAKIEPPPNADRHDLVFKITGTGKGATAFRINWRGPHRIGSCQVEVTVSG